MGITSSRVIKFDKTTVPKKGGVYLFTAKYNNKIFLKIGKTNKLKTRLQSYKNQNHTGGDFYNTINIIYLRQIKTKKQRTYTENKIREVLKNGGYKQVTGFFPNQKSKSLDFFFFDEKDFGNILYLFENNTRNSFFSDLKTIF